jgi:hypothetical protein
LLAEICRAGALWSQNIGFSHEKASPVRRES